MATNQSLFQLINPPTNHAPRGAYSHALACHISQETTLITTSGSIGVDPVSGKAPDSFGEQVKQALSNLKGNLAAAGAAPKDIVKITHYVTRNDPASIRGPWAEAFSEFIGDHRPPSSLIGVSFLATPELLYEVEAVAVVSRK